MIFTFKLLKSFRLEAVATTVLSFVWKNYWGLNEPMAWKTLMWTLKWWRLSCFSKGATFNFAEYSEFLTRAGWVEMVLEARVAFLHWATTWRMVIWGIHVRVLIPWKRTLFTPWTNIYKKLLSLLIMPKLTPSVCHIRKSTKV